MVFNMTVINNTTGATARVYENAGTGAIEVHDGDSIGYGGSEANPGKKVDLQKSPDGSTWTTFATTTASALGDFSFPNEYMPTPVPTTHYRRAISRTV
jgi:hypothetical protein